VQKANRFFIYGAGFARSTPDSLGSPPQASILQSVAAMKAA
jgi:hypothetical protein